MHAVGVQRKRARKHAFHDHNTPSVVVRRQRHSTLCCAPTLGNLSRMPGRTKQRNRPRREQPSAPPADEPPASPPSPSSPMPGPTTANKTLHLFLAYHVSLDVVSNYEDKKWHRKEVGQGSGGDHSLSKEVNGGAEGHDERDVDP